MSSHMHHRDVNPHHHPHPHPDHHDYPGGGSMCGEGEGRLSPQDIAVYRQLELLINHNPGIRHHLNNILHHGGGGDHYPQHQQQTSRNAFSISNLSAITEDSKASLAGYHRHSSDSRIDYNSAPYNSTFNSGVTGGSQQDSRSSRHHRGCRHSRGGSKCSSMSYGQTSSSECSELVFTPSDSSSTTDPHYPPSNESCSTCRGDSSCCYSEGHHTMTRPHYPTPDIRHHGSTGSGSTGSNSSSSCGESQSVVDLEESLHALSLAVNTSFSVCEYNCDEDSDSYAEEIDVDADTEMSSPCSTGGHHRSSIWSAGVSGSEHDYDLPQGHKCYPPKVTHERVARVFVEESEHARHSPDGKECTPTPLSKVIARTVSSSLEEIDHSSLYGDPNMMRSRSGASPALTKSSYCKCSHSSMSVSNASLRSRKHCKSSSSSEAPHKGSRVSVAYSSKSLESGESAASSSRSHRSHHQSGSSLDRSDRSDHSLNKSGEQKSSRRTEEKHSSAERRATEKHSSAERKATEKQEKRTKKAMNATHMTACSDSSTISAAKFCKMPPANCNSLAAQLGKIGLLRKIRKLNKKMGNTLTQGGNTDSSGKKQDVKNQSTFQHLGVL